MFDIHLQVKAKADLKKIWQYSYKEYGEPQADKYYDELIVGMNVLKDNPKIGVVCNYVREGYRQYKINRHFVFYKLTKNRVHIIRVLHENMKATKHL